MNHIVEIKAEIFDIIVTQENLQGQINQLQEIKQQKLQTLQQAIEAEPQPPEVSNDFIA
jgi:CHASE3 domain sensor protein